MSARDNPTRDNWKYSMDKTDKIRLLPKETRFINEFQRFS